MGYTNLFLLKTHYIKLCPNTQGSRNRLMEPISLQVIIEFRVLLLLDQFTSSLLSCRAISTDIPNPFSPPFRTTSHIGTELLYVGSSWSSCLCLSMGRGPQEYVTYEFVPTSPAVSRMSSLFKLDSFHDGW